MDHTSTRSDLALQHIHLYCSVLQRESNPIINICYVANNIDDSTKATSSVYH